MTKDYVCGTRLEPSTAAAKTDYEGDTYYFDSEECKDKFEADPERYVSRKESSAS